MKTGYLLVPLLSAVSVLGSCSSITASVVGYGMKSMFEVRNSSDSPEVYYQVGRYALAQNRLESAAQAYEKALALKSDFREASNGLAMVYALQGRYEAATERLQAAAAEAPDAGYLHNNLGYVLYLREQYREAIPVLEKAVSLEPDNARYRANLARAYEKAGDSERSRDEFARAAQLGLHADHAVATQGKQAGSTRASIASAGVPEQASDAARTKVGAERDGAAYPAPGNAVTVSSAPDLARSLGMVKVAPNIYELRAPAASPASAQAKPALHEWNAPPKPFRLEVSNGNGAAGMARRVADTLHRAGLNPVRLTNQRPWQRLTEIQYGEGYALEAARLAALLGQQALMIRSDRLRPDINVRLVLAQDIRDEHALVRSRDHRDTTRLASGE